MGVFDFITKPLQSLLGDIIGFLVGVDFDEQKDQAQGALVNKQSNIDPIPVVYGERKVGGVRVFVSTGGGKKNEFLYIALVLCEGEIQAIDEIYINDKLSTHSDYSGLISTQKFLGTDDQASSSLLAGADDTWGSNHRLRGVAYLAIRIKYDQDVFGGIPEIQCVIRGRKVFDPRDQTTAYSTNPALCLRDYLTNTRYGKGLPASAIDDTMFGDAADDCDELVTQYSGGSQVKVFECNARIDTGETLFNNVKELLQGMRGLLPYSDGKYGLIIDNVTSSTFNLTPDNILADVRLQNAGKSKRYNRVIAKFPNPDANWQLDSVTFPESGSADETTFLSEDNGEELIKEITLNTITSYYAARDIARIVCLASRRNVNGVSLTATSEALNIAIGDVVNVEHPSLGWTGAATQDMRVVGLQIRDQGEVELSLQEYNGSIYPWAVGAEAADNQETTLPDPFTIQPPQTPLTLTEGTTVSGDGTVFPSLNVSWTAADDAFVDEYEVQYKLTSDTNYTGYVKTIDTEVDLFGLLTGSEYTIRIRSINALGIRSSFISATTTLTGDSTAPGVPTSMTVTGGFKSIILTWTNPSDNDFSNVEIKRSPNATEGNATTIAITSSDTFTDEPFTGAIERYYWLRSVDTSGNTSAWVLAGNATSIPLVQDDIDDNIIVLDNFVQDLIDDFNAKANAADVLNVQVETGEVLDLETGQDVLIQNLGDVAIFVNESNQTINNSINSTNTTLANLEATVVDLTSGTSDIFVQPSAPVAGVGGVPDPIPTFSRWYDSDDSNEPYYWDGSSWQSLADPRIASNAAAITTLQSGLNTANSNISANSSAISVLDTTTVNQGNSITSISSDVTTLQSSLTTTQSDLSAAESDITTNASAISGLDTRVTSNEGSISSITSDVTQLQTDLTSAEGDISTNSTALSALTTRVTTAEGSISTNSTDITALETTVNDGATGVVATSNALSALTTRVTTAEGSISTNAADISELEITVNDESTGVAANASGLSALDTRVTTAEGSITTISSDITQLEADLTSAEGSISTNATALSSLTTRVDSAENSISTNASDISALELTVNDGSTGVAANASAISGIDTRLTTAEGSITSQASDITALETTVNDGSTGVAANASAITSLDTRITSAENEITTLSATNITALEVALDDLTLVQDESDNAIQTEAGDDLLLNLPTDVASATSAATNSLDTRITSAEGSITSQSADITQLQSDVITLDGETSGNASAISSLTTRVTSAEGSIVSQASDITTLQSGLSNAEGDISANSTAISGLTTRTTDAEGEISTLSSSITDLTSDLSDAENDISGNATAITNLTTRVTTAEGSITSQASDISSLQSSLSTTNSNVSANATAISGIDTRVTAAEGSISSQAASITQLQSDLSDVESDASGNSTAISLLDTRVTNAEGSISSNSSSITQLQSDVSDAESDISSNSTAISGLDTRVTSAEGSITSQAASITQLQSDLTQAESDISGNASSLSSLTTRVTNAEGSITSQGLDITQLQSDLTTAENDISANATDILTVQTQANDTDTVVSALSSSVTSLTTTVNNNTASITTNTSTLNGVEAQFTVTTNVNGNIAGFGLVSDIIDGNPTSEFIVQADKFKIEGTGAASDADPFIVYTSNTQVEKDGEDINIPAGVYIKDAFIQKAAIATANIQDLSVSNAKIGNLSVTAAKIQDLAVNTLKIGNNAVTIPYSEQGGKVDSIGTTNQAIIHSTGFLTHPSNTPYFIRFSGPYSALTISDQLQSSNTHYVSSTFIIETQEFNSSDTLLTTNTKTFSTLAVAGLNTIFLSLVQIVTSNANCAKIKVKVTMQRNAGIAYKASIAYSTLEKLSVRR